MSDRLTMNPGMIHAGIVEGSVAHVIASTWMYGNCYTNSIEIATALGFDPTDPADEITRLRAEVERLAAELELFGETRSALRNKIRLRAQERDEYRDRYWAALAAYEAQRGEGQ